MNATLMLGLAALSGLVVASGVVIDAGRAPASPRLLAAVYLVVLLAWAVLPATILVCVVDGLLRLVAGGSRPAAGACWLGIGAGEWHLIVYGVGVAALTPLLWQGWQVHAFVRRTRLTPWCRRRASEVRLGSGGSVLVLQTATPLAHASGLLRPYAVVSSGLLDTLDEQERRAVCEHEAAHIRLGHTRLLVLGSIVARAYAFLPPVRQVYSKMQRELEAAADDEAAAVVGVRTLLSALARVSLSHAGPIPSFSETEHLRYRIARLDGDRGDSPRSNARVATAGVGMLALLIWWSCAFVSASPDLVGLGACMVVAGPLCLRPLWGRRARDGCPAGGLGGERSTEM